MQLPPSVRLQSSSSTHVFGTIGVDGINIALLLGMRVGWVMEGRLFAAGRRHLEVSNGLFSDTSTAVLLLLSRSVCR